jgi:hypothetical protein
MKKERIPELNEYGLVLSPTKQELIALRPQRTRPLPEIDKTNRHHLYWPATRYAGSRSSLVNSFREHRFNSVWILMSDHDNYHATYDGVPVPHRAVMHEFMREADLLTQLGVSVNAIENINKGLEIGKRINNARTERRKEERLFEVIEGIEEVERINFIPEVFAKKAIERAMSLPEYAEIAA